MTVSETTPAGEPSHVDGAVRFLSTVRSGNDVDSARYRIAERSPESPNAPAQHERPRVRYRESDRSLALDAFRDPGGEP